MGLSRLIHMGAIMNPKLIAAFFTGAMIAAGIVYVAARPDSPPAKLQTVAAANTQTAIPAPPPPPVLTSPVTVDVPAVAPPAKAVREKPSPLIPPVRKERPPVIAQKHEPAPPPPVQHERPAAVAQNQPPPVPAREPVFKERPYNETKPAADPAPENIQQPPPAVQQPPMTAVPVEEPRYSPPPSDVRTPHTVTIVPGTPLAVRIGETLSARSNEAGDSFLATLDQPLVVDGFVIAERGSRVEGRVVQAEAQGRAKGSSLLGIELVKISTSDGQHVRIHTAAYKKESNTSTGQDVATVGAIAAIGAAIGAAADGGKGAAVGAGLGGAAGVAGVMLNRGRPVEIPVETRLSFRIQEPVTITERLN
jgi:outer membrane biosynthesis protein TonB